MDSRWFKSIMIKKGADKLPEARGGRLIHNSSLYRTGLEHAGHGTHLVTFRKRYQRNGAGSRTSCTFLLPKHKASVRKSLLVNNSILIVCFGGILLFITESLNNQSLHAKRVKLLYIAQDEMMKAFSYLEYK